MLAAGFVLVVAEDTLASSSIPSPLRACAAAALGTHSPPTTHPFSRAMRISSSTAARHPVLVCPSPVSSGNRCFSCVMSRSRMSRKPIAHVARPPTDSPTRSRPFGLDAIRIAVTFAKLYVSYAVARARGEVGPTRGITLIAAPGAAAAAVMPGVRSTPGLPRCG